MPSTKTTLSEIADICGVSRQVVSAIVNGKEAKGVRFSDETVKRVMDTVYETGYRPNRTVSNFFSKRHNCLGILTRYLYLIPRHSLSKMFDISRQMNLLLVMEKASTDPAEMPAFVREDCVDGVVVFDDIRPEFVEEMERVDLPAVFVNCNYRDGGNCICYDETQGMELIMRHFHEIGRKNIVSFFNANEEYYFKARIEGLRQAAGRYGLCYQSFTYFDESVLLPSATPRIHEFLQQHPDVDGTIILDDAAPRLYAAIAQLGRSVPDDISVIGINDSEIAQGLAPSITAIRIEHEHVGELAISRLNDLISGKVFQIPQILPYELKIRGSA